MFPVLTFCRFRKDSRLYSYLPVVGMTLKLYNLLPHPTVQASSQVTSKDRCFNRDKLRQLQTAFTMEDTDYRKNIPLSPQSYNEVILNANSLVSKFYQLFGLNILNSRNLASCSSYSNYSHQTFLLQEKHCQCSTDVTSRLRLENNAYQKHHTQT